MNPDYDGFQEMKAERERKDLERAAMKKCKCNDRDPLFCHECEESTGVCYCKCHICDECGVDPPAHRPYCSNLYRKRRRA